MSGLDIDLIFRVRDENPEAKAKEVAREIEIAGIEICRKHGLTYVGSSKRWQPVRPELLE